MSKPPSLAGQFAVLLRWLLVRVVPVLGIVLLPFLPPAFGAHELWGIPLSLAALALYWAALSASGPDYPATAFGATERIDADTFRDELERCAACDRTTRQGLYRRYARQWVVAGVPFYTLEWGTNAYCPNCIDSRTLDVVGPTRGSDSEAVDEAQTAAGR